MTLSLTNRCNFRCDYCYIPLQKRDELTTEEWCEAIDDLVAGGMGRASLIGGEPLVRKDVGPILAHLKRRGVHVAMNTNGWFVPDRIDDIADLDLVCVTVDGPEDVHDTQRHKGSHERALRALESLASRGIPTVTMTVVTAGGIDNVRSVLEVAREYGAKAFFQLEHDAEVDVDAPIAPHITQDRVAAFVEELKALKAEGWPVGNSATILQKQAEARYLGSCEDCHAGRYYGYVFSDGTVAPCLLTQRQVKIGNGRDNGYTNAFHALEAPRGPGCSCVPTHQVNHVLDFDPRVVFDALQLAVGSTFGSRRAGSPA